MQITTQDNYEQEFPCDFSAIMDCGIINEGSSDPIQYPSVVIPAEDCVTMAYAASQVALIDLMREPLPESIAMHSFAIPVKSPAMVDPVGDLILHFSIFYEHVYLLEGFPEAAQPQLHELRLLGKRIHDCLLNRDGTLLVSNVKRCEAAHMSVTLDNGFIQVVRGKAVLRQKV